MKKLSLALAVILSLTALTACTNTPATTTAGSDSKSSSTTTNKVVTTKPQGTPDPTTPAPETSTPVSEESLSIKMPCAKSGDLVLEGYEANGYWLVEDDGKIASDDKRNVLVVTNDKMASGKLTATFTSNGSSTENDNGIIFGLGENLFGEDDMIWEDPSTTPPYYFLFVSDAGTLYLAKVADGQPWNALEITKDRIEGYEHGTTVTISVEFDGRGHILCYANDLLMIDYTDASPLNGERYGIRCEVESVIYESVVAEHS